MKRAACSSELVTRARRGALATSDRMRLEAHLEACATCRLEHRIGADFDSIGALRPGDELLDARLADAVARRLGAGAPARRRALRGAAMAACLLLAAGAAGATLGLRASHRTAPGVAAQPPGDPTSLTAAGPPAAGPGASNATSSTGNAEVLSPMAPSVAAPAPAAPAVRPSAARTEATPSPVSIETASSLFEAANAERRRSHFTTALSLYDQLQRRFPASDEAHVSHVSLGRLLLDRGLWADAVQQLDAYLVRGGTLVPEALFGKARALDALGRRSDAEEAWRLLISTAPESAYAPQTRERLDSARPR
jgi:TolA-binding protein